MLNITWLKELDILILILKNRGLKATEIADALYIPPASVYAILYRLAGDDYIGKTNDGYWYPTEKAWKLLERIYQEIGSVLQTKKEVVA